MLGLMAHRRSGFEVIYITSIEGFPTNLIKFPQIYRANFGKYWEINIGELRNIGRTVVMTELVIKGEKNYREYRATGRPGMGHRSAMC